MSILTLLSKKVKQALISVIGHSDYDPKICQSTRAHFGDYQINGVMSIAKKLNISSKQLAEQIQIHLDLNGIASKIEVVGPGFINVFLNSAFLAKNIDLSLRSKNFNINRPSSQTVIVDYSSPNIAKEMHVGHLRSTIIGDAMVRTLEFLGHKVIRVNHIGDWGTQFGMLIAFLKEKQQKNTSEIVLEDLENFYREAKKLYDEDKVFAELARSYVVKLQNGDEYSLQMWKELVTSTMVQNQIIYDRLNVTLSIDDIKGESFYNAMLPDVVADLKAKGLAVESEGATVVFLDEFKNKSGKAAGIIIQKKDGGYLYVTTDIACIKYRYETLHADRILYYTDCRQHEHLAQAWAIAKKAGYIPDSALLEHHMFGMMLNAEGRPFKTRSGNTIRLSELLDEAINRARRFLIEKNPTKPSNEIERLSTVVGIGALKYADLSRNRIANYIFDWDNMFAFEGNTALYIQYAYTRTRSIFRKAGIIAENNESQMNLDFFNTMIVFSGEHEKKLALHLLQFEEILSIIARDGTFHIMCAYLYDLAGIFSNFYEYYPILSVKNRITRNSRLKLVLLTAKILRLGLHILGIETVEKM